MANFNGYKSYKLHVKQGSRLLFQTNIYYINVTCKGYKAIFVAYSICTTYIQTYGKYMANTWRGKYETV